MKLSNLDATTLMDVASLDRSGSNLIIKGTILGSMPVTCMLTPAEGRAMFKLMSPRLIGFLVTFLFRR